MKIILLLNQIAIQSACLKSYHQKKQNPTLIGFCFRVLNEQLFLIHDTSCMNFISYSNTY